MVRPETALPEVGDLVVLTRGLNTVRATVLNVYEGPRGPRVTLSVPIVGPDNELISDTQVTVRAERVRPVEVEQTS